MISMVWLARDMAIRACHVLLGVFGGITLFALLDAIAVVVGEWSGVF